MASHSSLGNAGTVVPSPSDPTSNSAGYTAEKEQLIEAQTQTPMAISTIQPQEDTTLPSTKDDSTQQQADATAAEAASAPAPAVHHEPSITAISTSEPPAVAPVPTRKHSEALGPATDSPIAPPPSTISTGTTLSISLMLTTGARHPYKIDERYLTARKVNATNADGTFDPRELSGYQLKELIWIDWRTEWDPRPVSPSSIRLIILGRMIEDKASLKDFPFNLSSVNVVHMTVKPADLHEDDETAGKGGKSSTFRGRDDGEGGAGCRCVIL